MYSKKIYKFWKYIARAPMEHPKPRLRLRSSIKSICFVDAADPSESEWMMRAPS